MIFMEEGAKSAFGAKAVDDPHGFQDSPLDSPARTPGTRTPVLVRKQSDVPLPARIDTAALLVTVETSVGDQKMTIAEAIKTRPPAAYMDAFKDTMPLPAPRLHSSSRRTATYYAAHASDADKATDGQGGADGALCRRRVVPAGSAKAKARSARF